eukprot:TRINITY_DN898_c1_g1_i1.p1 TRINITY_DN898_c1_g1~~TRINITY_DN898_c1_g1_i1.p1  ORF type:complete len:1793 (+),score=365.55 TRINITY_DN898_c1_g1_i1:43-5379(+)
MADVESEINEVTQSIKQLEQEWNKQLERLNLLKVQLKSKKTNTTKLDSYYSVDEEEEEISGHEIKSYSTSLVSDKKSISSTESSILEDSEEEDADLDAKRIKESVNAPKSDDQSLVIRQGSLITAGKKLPRKKDLVTEPKKKSTYYTAECYDKDGYSDRSKYEEGKYTQSYAPSDADESKSDESGSDTDTDPDSPEHSEDTKGEDTYTQVCSDAYTNAYSDDYQENADDSESDEKVEKKKGKKKKAEVGSDDESKSTEENIDKNTANNSDLSISSAPTMYGGSLCDWNSQFQDLLMMNDNKQKFKKLASLERDFLYVAETYGRIIISEKYLDVSQKTIKPSSIGGTAGGEKYICQNILFKFAVDPAIGDGWLYGGDTENIEKAMKAACNELKGLTAFFHAAVANLHFPLMTVIHHRGWCLSAMSILPLGSDTLKYGSSDGGRTIVADETISEIMKDVGRLLNLREHVCSDKSIIGPGDIEVHLGKDNRYYVIDFGRLMPPEAPLKSLKRPGRPIFYDLLRPVFVQQYSKPLCSDAFSGWLQFDPDKKELNKDVKNATKYLYNDKIPRFVTTLQSYMEPDQFISQIHKYGINCRHMGSLRKCLITYGRIERLGISAPWQNSYSNNSNVPSIFDPIKYFIKMIMTECVSRTMKNELREILRHKMKQLKIATEDPYREAAYLYFKDRLFCPPQVPKKFVPVTDYGDELQLHDTVVARKIVLRSTMVEDTQFTFILSHPVPPYPATFYYEITLERGLSATIGLSPCKPDLNLYSIDEPEVNKFKSTGTIECELSSSKFNTILDPWNVGDTVGLLYNMTEQMLAFTKNGQLVGNVIYGLKSNLEYIPIIGVGPNTKVVWNFGVSSPFKFAVDSFCDSILLPPATNPVNLVADRFWKSKDGLKAAVNQRFPFCLIPYEEDESFDLRNSVDMGLLIQRLNKSSGVLFSSSLLQVKSHTFIRVLESDIVSLYSRKSQMGIILYAEAVHTLLSMEEQKIYDETQISSLLTAESKLASVIQHTNLKHARDYFYWGSIWWEIAKRQTNDAVKQSSMKKAEELFQCVENIEDHRAWNTMYSFWFSGGLNELMSRLWIKQAEIYIAQHVLDKAGEQLKKAFKELPDLALNLFNKYSQNIVHLTNRDELLVQFNAFRVIWDSSSKPRKLLEMYIETLCISISNCHGHIAVNWSNEAIEMLKELQDTLFSIQDDDVIREILDHKLRSTLDGLHYAAILYVSKESKLLSITESVLNSITFPVLHNTPPLFDACVHEFLYSVKMKQKNIMGELTFVLNKLIEDVKNGESIEPNAVNLLNQGIKSLSSKSTDASSIIASGEDQDKLKWLFSVKSISKLLYSTPSLFYSLTSTPILSGIKLPKPKENVTKRSLKLSVSSPSSTRVHSISNPQTLSLSEAQDKHSNQENKEHKQDGRIINSLFAAKAKKMKSSNTKDKLRDKKRKTTMEEYDFSQDKVYRVPLTTRTHSLSTPTIQQNKMNSPHSSPSIPSSSTLPSTLNKGNKKGIFGKTHRSKNEKKGANSLEELSSSPDSQQRNTVDSLVVDEKILEEDTSQGDVVNVENGTVDSKNTEKKAEDKPPSKNTSPQPLRASGESPKLQSRSRVLFRTQTEVTKRNIRSPSVKAYVSSDDNHESLSQSLKTSHGNKLETRTVIISQDLYNMIKSSSTPSITEVVSTSPPKSPNKDNSTKATGTPTTPTTQTVLSGGEGVPLRKSTHFEKSKEKTDVEANGTNNGEKDDVKPGHDDLDDETEVESSEESFVDDDEEEEEELFSIKTKIL